MIEQIKFNYNTTAVSQKSFENHNSLYEKYVSKANEITNELSINPDYKNTNATYSKFRELKKEFSFALNGVILHELYFMNMSDKIIDNTVIKNNFCNKTFGNYEKWEQDFIATGISARGWCITVFDQRSNDYKNILLDSHYEGLTAYCYPLIVMDMYEHAYFLDYEIDKNSYIKKFINSIDWNCVNNRLKICETI